MELDRNAWVLRWAYLGVEVPRQTTIGTLGYRAVIVTPLACLGMFVWAPLVIGAVIAWALVASLVGIERMERLEAWVSRVWRVEVTGTYRPRVRVAWLYPRLD